MMESLDDLYLRRSVVDICRWRFGRGGYLVFNKVDIIWDNNAPKVSVKCW